MCKLHYKVTVQSKYNINKSIFEWKITSTDVSCFFFVWVNANNIALEVNKEKSNCTSLKIKFNYFLLLRMCVCACGVCMVSGREWWRREYFLLQSPAKSLFCGTVAIEKDSSPPFHLQLIRTLFPWVANSEVQNVQNDDSSKERC